MYKKKYAKIDKKISLLNAKRPLDDSEQKLIRSVFEVEQAYATNAIEGSTLTLKETQAYIAFGITAKGKPLRDHLEISGHQSAMEYIYELTSGKSKRTISEVDIRQLHTLLFKKAWENESDNDDVVGKYKIKNNHVLTQSGKIHYYAESSDVPSLMQAFVKFFNKPNADLHTVEACAQIHHKFTAIHPFADGNGRMARILSNLYLIQRGWPPFTIEPNIRDRYYRALEKADKGDFKELYKLFAKVIERCIDIVLKILEKNYQPKTSKHQLYFVRVSKKITQAELAKKSKITQARISKIENNAEIPGEKTLLKLAKALSVNISELM